MGLSQQPNQNSRPKLNLRIQPEHPCSEITATTVERSRKFTPKIDAFLLPLTYRNGFSPWAIGKKIPIFDKRNKVLLRRIMC